MNPAVLAAILLLAPALASAGPYIRLAEDKGAWWLVDAGGNRFLSRGVNAVNPGVAPGDFDPANPAYCALRLYPAEERWRGATAARLEKWGFNTVGGGSDRGIAAAAKIPYAVTLSLGKAVGVPWTDPQDPEARAAMAKACAGLKAFAEDPLLAGYFLDSELGWWDETMLISVLKQAWKSPLKRRVWEMLSSDYSGDIKAFLADFDVEPRPKSFEDVRGPFRRAGFKPGARPLSVERYAEWYAERYYAAACAELRRVDPNHLVLGDRFANYYSQPVVRAASRHVDVISVNYNTLAPQGWASPYFFEGLWRLGRKPVLVSEFYFASMENATKCQNRNGPYMTVPTQKDRADGARRLATGMARYPFVVGWHWYQYYDQPAGGRDAGGGGEDFNMGLVDVKDQMYPDLISGLDRAGKASAAGHGTWPTGAGLVRSPEGWRVPAMQEMPVVDGVPDEWNLEKTWNPALKGAAPFERFGDIHMAWHPEGLAVLVTYMDFRDRPGAPGRPEQDTERLTIGFGGEDEAPVVLTLKGLLERKDPAHPDQGFYTPEVLTVRGGVPFPAEGRLIVSQKMRGTHGTIEIFMPAGLFKREKLEAGSPFRATVSLRLRANHKEMFWPATFRMTDYADSREWAPLLLEAAQ